MDINWQWKTYDELSKTELYSMLRSRNEVFILEKKCPWNEIDGHDEEALHLLGYDKSALVAYARLLCPKIDGEAVHFGRVLVVKEHRGKGIANIILEKIFEKIAALGYQTNRIEILANYNPATEKLYSTFGFYPTAKPYPVEGNTELVPMARPPLSNSKAPFSPTLFHDVVDRKKDPVQKAFQPYYGC